MQDQEKRPLVSTHYKLFAVIVVAAVIVAFVTM